MLVGVAELERQGLDRRPVHPEAEGRQAAEVRQVLIADVEIGRQVADRRQDLAAAAGDGDAEAGLAVEAVARLGAFGGQARANAGGVQGPGVGTDAEGGGDPAGRQIEHVAVQHQFGRQHLGDRVGGVTGQADEVVGRQDAVGIGGRIIGVQTRLERTGGGEAPAAEGVGFDAVVVAVEGPAPVVAEEAVDDHADAAGQAVGLTIQGEGVQDPADRGGRERGRERASDRHRQDDSRQAVEAEAGAILEAGADGGLGGVVQVALVGAAQGGPLALAQQGAEGVDVVELCRARVALDVALGFVQRAGTFVFGVHRPADRARDVQGIALDLGGGATALGGHAAGDLAGEGAEIGLEHEVHDPLVSGVAVFQRDLLGEDVHPLDGFRRQALDLAEAGDAAAVDQEDRHAVGATARAAGQGLQIGQEFGDVGGTVGGDLFRAQGDVRRDVGVDAAPRAHAGGDHVVQLKGVRSRGGGRRRGRRLLRRLLRRGRRRSLDQAGQEAGQGGGDEQHAKGPGEKLALQRARPTFPSHFSEETEG